MHCKTCPSYRGNICGKAQEGLISEMETECLLKCQVMLLRDIWGELAELNDNKDEGEGWKPDGDVYVPCCQEWRDPYKELWIARDDGIIDIFCIVHTNCHLGYDYDLP
jgi:hypothetical protein